MTRLDFNDLVKQLSRKMYGFAFRILNNREEAEDAVQEVFIKLWKLGDKLGEYNSIEALATTMTKNHCIDQIRKRKHNFTEEYIDQGEIRFSFPSPHEQLEDRESDEIIYRIIEDMQEPQRQILKFREIEGLSYEEISQKTGQNINALRVTISRARKAIRDEYNKYQYERKRTGQFARKVL
jgi:RNA polymerase sigma-70 factor (ECF subfamily)